MWCTCCPCSTGTWLPTAIVQPCRVVRRSGGFLPRSGRVRPAGREIGAWKVKKSRDGVEVALTRGRTQPLLANGMLKGHRTLSERWRLAVAAINERLMLKARGVEARPISYIRLIISGTA